jgi:hypothetical protein
MEAPWQAIPFPGAFYTRWISRGHGAMEVLLDRPVVVGIAIAGALFSLAAAALQKKGVVTVARANRRNNVGCVMMGVSMLLFVDAALRGGAA